MVKRKEREAALEILRISTLLALPLSFICTFLLFVTPCLFRDKICNPAPFFSAYAWGFAVGYLISDKILHMSDWILDESKRPDLAEGRKGCDVCIGVHCSWVHDWNNRITTVRPYHEYFIHTVRHY